MSDLSITLTITSETALSVGAGGSAGTLADKSIVRDGRGQPIIPGSQVKGKARWAAEQLLRGLGQDIPAPFDERDRVEQSNPVRAIFGSPEQRSPLYFADLIGVIGATDQAESLYGRPEQHHSLIRPSVSINRRRGTAEDARLFFQETALEGARFFAAPAISGALPDLEHVALLWAALCLTDRWGGAKSRGLGWAMVEIDVTWDGRRRLKDELAQALRTLVTIEGGV